jgi:protein-S-isoprenylcysteine O-methyltransferase Ste14
MSTASNAIKTGLFTVFVPLIVGVGIPQAMIAQDQVAISGVIIARLAGGLLFVAGVIGYFWCAALLVRAQGTPVPLFPTKRAVVGGPYRVNRNPIYCSVLAVVFGQAVLYQSWMLAGYGAFLLACFHLFVVVYEERNLRMRFGGEYQEFCMRVPRWIPGLKGQVRR